MKKHHPRAPSRSHVLSILFFSVEANFQLVVAYPSRSAAARGLGVIYILFIFVSPITAPNNRKTHLHTFLPSHSSSVRLFLLLTPSLVWLLYLPIDRRPPKAKAPIFSLFFDGVYMSASQTRVLTTVSVKPPPGALHKLIGHFVTPQKHTCDSTQKAHTT